MILCSEHVDTKKNIFLTIVVESFIYVMQRKMLRLLVNGWSSLLITLIVGFIKHDFRNIKFKKINFKHYIYFRSSKI